MQVELDRKSKDDLFKSIRVYKDANDIHPAFTLKKNGGKFVSIFGMIIGLALIIWSYFLFTGQGTDFFTSVLTDIFGAGLILFLGGLVYFLFKIKLIA